MNPKRLIEEWLPIKEIGVESRRESSTGQHPPPNRLHVWCRSARPRRSGPTFPATG